jgi:hypothetical protein
MEFNINKIPLPILKLELIQDKRNDFQIPRTNTKRKHYIYND